MNFLNILYSTVIFLNVTEKEILILIADGCFHFEFFDSVYPSNRYAVATFEPQLLWQDTGSGQLW